MQCAVPKNNSSLQNYMRAELYKQKRKAGTNYAEKLPLRQKMTALNTTTMLVHKKGLPMQSFLFRAYEFFFTR